MSIAISGTKIGALIWNMIGVHAFSYLSIICKKNFLKKEKNHGRCWVIMKRTAYSYCFNSLSLQNQRSHGVPTNWNTILVWVYLFAVDHAETYGANIFLFCITSLYILTSRKKSCGKKEIALSQYHEIFFWRQRPFLWKKQFLKNARQENGNAKPSLD